jgi:hypothetical protein
MQSVLCATAVPGADYLTTQLSQLAMLACNGLFIVDPRCLDLAITLHAVHPKCLGALVEFLVLNGLVEGDRVYDASGAQEAIWEAANTLDQNDPPAECVFGWAETCTTSSRCSGEG